LRFALAVIITIAVVLPVVAQLEDETAPPEPPLRVRISMDVSDASTRLVITHSRKVQFAVMRSEGSLNVVYGSPIRVTPASRTIDGLLLAGWSQTGDATLELILGPGFDRHEEFELRNPSRLVIDLLPGTKNTTDRARTYTIKEPTGPIIVIDPGHGGVETGAIGPSGLNEKDVALDLGRRLKESLERDPDVTVVLTRKDDRFVELDERTSIANHNRADLFLSIHLNSSRRKSAHGAETYFLSAEATDNEARTLAALENQAHGADTSSKSSSDGKKDALDLILWDLAQNQYLAQSALLAESVQSELNRLANTHDRGVRQAPFRVLMGATMPAILVEVGFISNADEELLFKNPQYRNRVVEAMSRAVRDYLDQMADLTGPGAVDSGGALEP
jgi:N-acetylmuramoyl-L-alanine amidase